MINGHYHAGLLLHGLRLVVWLLQTIGEKALREIRFYQRNTDLLIRKVLHALLLLIAINMTLAYFLHYYLLW